MRQKFLTCRGCGAQDDGVRMREPLAPDTGKPLALCFGCNYQYTQCAHWPHVLPVLSSDNLRTGSVYPVRQSIGQGEHLTLNHRIGASMAILVMRTWPRGVPREGIRWVRHLAPTQPLLRDYRAQRIDWETFAARYRAEIQPYLWYWRAFLRGRLMVADDILLLCWERHAEGEAHVRCHRRILVGLLTGVEFEERQP